MSLRFDVISRGALPYQITGAMLGQIRISCDSREIFVAILGSCVSVCLFDRCAKIGGMNHFILPHSAFIPSQSKFSSGVYAKESLVDGLLLYGARRGNLQCKVFGGATVQPRLGDIGNRNSEFIREYLSSEGIICVAFSLGGSKGRRIRFWPVSGRAQHAWMRDAGDGIMVNHTNRNEIPVPARVADM